MKDASTAAGTARHGGPHDGPAAPARRTTRRTHLLVAATASAAGLLVAACGRRGTSETAPSTTKAALTGTLRYRTWWAPSSPPEKTWWEFVKPDFEAKHPGATLDLEFIDASQAYQKFVTSMASGDLP